MCQIMIENGSFDPSLCPLLQNLSPEEIAIRMKQEPFVSCQAQFDAVRANPGTRTEYQCPATARDVIPAA